MTKFTLKAILITLSVCCISLISKAQVGYDFPQYDLGFSGSVNMLHSDVKTPKTTAAIHINFNYNFTPYTNYILEFEAGKLGGGNAVKDVYGRVFEANYTSYSFRAQLQAGELIDYSHSAIKNALKNFYLGAGIGMINDNITSINRYSTIIPGYYTPGQQSSRELYIPARIGYEFKIFNKFQQPSLKIDFAYQYDFIMGDELDGFKAGAHNDVLTQFTVGLKFDIGGVTSYRKQVHY